VVQTQVDLAVVVLHHLRLPALHHLLLQEVLVAAEVHLVAVVLVVVEEDNLYFQ
jgi:hypothetical protein